jgi:hypothetical protein
MTLSKVPMRLTNLDRDLKLTTEINIFGVWPSTLRIDATADLQAHVL